MAIQTLGISNIPLAPGLAPGLEIGQVSQPSNLPVQAPRPTGDAALTSEVGATGTPIFSGFLRELGEYNAALTWPAAYLVYEEMRRSDAHVAATLWASKLPIRGAEWQVQAPKDPLPIEQEASDFCEETLFDGDNDFDAMLENALLCLDFGAALQENVFAIDGDKVRIAKTAPRLPLTFYRWLCDPGTDNLNTIEQLGYRAGQYVRTQLPLDRCTLFTFRQEGANFTGQSLLRQMYQHWYIKSGLYRVDAIACERNGMGVPVVTMGPDWKREDKSAALDWVQALVTHQRTGLVLPPQWAFALEGVKGTLRDPKESIAHHGTLITLVGLAQFMMMGQSSKGGGNRSLGETMSDFFFMGLQATANYIANRLNKSLIKQVCDYNFEGLKRYPRLVPQQVMALDFQAITQGLAQLGTGGIITPTPELEAWLRQKFGAPEADKATIIRERAAIKKTSTSGPFSQQRENGPGFGNGAPGAAPGAQAPAPGAPAGAAPAAVPGPKSDALDTQAEEDEQDIEITASEITPANDDRGGAVSQNVTGESAPTTNSGDAASSGAQGGSPAPQTQTLKLRREPRGAELHLALSDIVSRLDGGKKDVAASLRAARPRIQAEVIHKLVDSPVRSMHRVSIAPDQKLIDEVEGHLQGVSNFGREQVAREKASQRAGKGPGDAATIRMADAGSKRAGVGLYADGVVSKFVNGLTSRAANAAVNAKRSASDYTTKGELINAIGDDLDDQSDKWIEGLAGEGANEAFADGRRDGYEENKDDVSKCIYSALLDANMCDPCGAADGSEGATPDDLPDTPNPDCEGGDKCRCVIVYVFSDEGTQEEAA